jgi:hypothetical protein
MPIESYKGSQGPQAFATKPSIGFLPDHPIDSTTLPITLQIWPATADPHVPALDPRAALAPQRIALAMPAV